MKYISAFSVLLFSILIGSFAAPTAIYAGEEEQQASDAAAEAKKAWMDMELDFASDLVVTYGYQDLYDLIVDNVRSGKGWDDKALTADQEGYLKSRLAKNKIDIALKLTDPDEKIDQAGKALEVLKGIVSALPEGQMKQDAEVDLIDGYFRLGVEFKKEVDKMKDDELFGVAAPENKDAPAVSAQDIANLQAKVDSAAKKNKEAKAKYETAKKKRDKNIDKIKASMDKASEALSKARDELNKAVGKSGLAGKAATFFTDGMNIATPLHEKLTDQFEDLRAALMEAESKREQAAIMPKAQKSFETLIKLRHSMERAYAAWVFLLDRGSKAQLKILSQGDEFFDYIAMDYDDTIPWDKQVYSNWIMMTSGKDDPLLATGEDGKPLPKEDEFSDKGDYNRYLWPSIRMKFFFEHNFLEKPSAKGVTVPDAYRIKGLYDYCEALMNMAIGAFDKADAEADAGNKKAWQAHGAALMADAEKMLDEMVKPESTLFNPKLKIDLMTRLTARLRLRTRFQLYKAVVSKKLGSDEKAQQFIQAAMNECSLVTSEGGPAWKYHSQNRIQEIQAVAEANQIQVGPSIDAMLADAEDLMRQISKEPVLEKQLALRVKANAKYLEALEIAKKIPDNNAEGKKRRAGYLMGLYMRAGINAMVLEDWMLAYFLNFAAVQEFNPADYPRDTYAGIDKTYLKLINNLRYAAGKFRKVEGTIPSQKLYVDALLLSMAKQEEASGEVNDDLVVILINELQSLKFYEDALEYIDQVPTDHIYYRSILLMAAGICQKMIKQMQDDIEKADKKLNPEGKQPLEGPEADALKAEVAKWTKEKESWGTKAKAYAEKFLSEMKDRQPLEADADPKKKDVYDNEDKNIPAAYIIPMNIEFTSGNYQPVIEYADKAAEKVKSLKVIDEAEKNANLTNIYYLKFLSCLRLKDVKTDPMDEAWAQLEVAGKVVDELDAVDTDGERSNQAVLLLGGAWNNLANRYEHASVDPANKDKKEELLAKLQEGRLKVPFYFSKAEGAIYKQINLVLVMVRIYSNEGKYEKAKEICDKGIKYWGDSLFTDGYLLKEKKTLVDLKAATPLADIGVGAKIQGAADDKALVDVLNDFIINTKYADAKSAIDGVLAAGLKAAEGMSGKDAARYLDNVKQGLVLAKRGDINDARELKQRLNRIVLEAAYPEVLARSSLMPVIPEASEFDYMSGYNLAKGLSQDGGFAHLYPANPEGRKKSALLTYMIDHRLGAGDVKEMEEYRKTLEEELENTQSVAKRRQLSGWIDLFDDDLRTRLYGIEDKGRLLKLSYGRAAQMVDSIIEFNAKRIPLNSAQVRKIPIEDFLLRCKGGATFNQQIFAAQKSYVEALMAVNDSKEALVYLDKLIEIYPTDKELKLKYSLAESLMAKSSMEKKKYGQEEASLFMTARMRTLDIYKVINKAPLIGSELWWNARMLLFENDLSEIEVRNAAGAKELDKAYTTPWLKYDRNTQQMVEVPIPSQKSMTREGQNLRNEIIRLLKRKKKGPDDQVGIEISKERMDRLDAILKRLDELKIEKLNTGGGDAGDKDETEKDG
ncbi:MAG: hypothetical protein JXR97_17145 [Planctomycetes bacterium]|nr:hypothetical protein [Planctomycetota bacterium]